MSQQVKVYRELQFYCGGAKTLYVDPNTSTTVVYVLPNTDATESLAFGNGTKNMDVTFYGDVVTNYMTWDESTNKLTFSGLTEIAMGSYASPKEVGSATGVHFAYWSGTGSGAASFHIGHQVVMKTTETGRPFPLCVQAEADGVGVGPDRIEAAQFISLLGAGGEATHLTTLGGDATAGMYATWHKVGANTSCVCEAGCRVAAVWLDNQMNCVVSGEEYAAFITCGGSKVDAVFGFETTSSGWTNLLYFDETAYDQDPVASTGCTIATGDTPYLKVSLNGTAYGIPIIAI